jgi:acyl transferase domain-containing protein
VFSLEDGLRLIAARARLMQALPAGSMAAVFAPEAQVAEVIRPFGGALSVAALNGPDHVVISGETAAIDAAVAHFTAGGVGTQRLVVSHAFHSASMDPMLADFERRAAAVAFSVPKVPLASNLTGQFAGGEIATSAYWRDHVRRPVRFVEGLARLREAGCTLFLEVGPRATLLGMARRAADLDASCCLASLRPPREEWAQMLDTTAALYTSGAPVDWSGFDLPYARRKVSAPTYRFQRERYWLDGAGLAPSGSETAHAVSSSPAPAASASWMYQVEWMPQPESGADAAPGGRWVILADSGTVARRLADAFQARGDRAALIFADETTGRSPDGSWRLNPARGDDFSHVLQEIASADAAPIRGVVHLWSLDAAAVSPSAPTEAFERAQQLGTGSVVRLLQAMVRSGVAAPLKIVTRGVQRVDSADTDAPSIAQAAVWGLGRTLAVEHPEIWGGLIDIANNDVERLAREIARHGDEGDEDQVALRESGRYVARLSQMPALTASFGGCRADASYLITGGLGVLGLQVASWLVDQGARHLVLAGRRGLPERSTWDELPRGGDASRQAAAIRELEKRGATVSVAAVDIASERDVATLFERFGTSVPVLRGIVHAAATMGAARLRDMPDEALTSMLRPKVAGTWNLHRAASGADLDFFVLFSSVSSLLGTVDLAHYGAANSFLDAFAEYRRALGQTAVSINWGAWESLRGSASHRDVFSRSGMRSLPSASALEMLGRVIAADLSRTVVASVDWTTFKPVYEAKRRRPFLDLIAGRGAAAAAAGRQALIEALRGVEPDKRRPVIVEHVREAAAGVLGLSPRQIDVRKGFFDLGMDSLMSVELRKRLEAATGVTLPTTLTFRYSTVGALAEFLDETLAGPAPAGAPAAALATGAVADAGDAESDALSEDELAALLADKLAQIR